jgi:hypothetical protein
MVKVDGEWRIRDMCASNICMEDYELLGRSWKYIVLGAGSSDMLCLMAG